MKRPYHMFVTASFFICWILMQSNEIIAQGEDEKFPPQSLQGIAEPMLINGQPGLRIQFRNNQSAEIRMETRDGEDALVFSVLKIITSVGRLYVTKSAITYAPSDDPDKYFKIQRSTIKDVQFKDHWRLNGALSNVNVIYSGDEKAFSLIFPNKGDKAMLLAGNQFLFRAIKDFDGAFEEFKRLTASVRPASDDDEEEFEDDADSEPMIRYDRFKDLTIVSTPRITLKGKRTIRLSAEYSYAGKVQKEPETITLVFSASAARPVFREDDLELNFLIDGERRQFGQPKIADEEKKGSMIRQTVKLSMTASDFYELTNGKSVEFQISSLEYKFSEKQLEMLRNLRSLKREE